MAEKSSESAANSQELADQAGELHKYVSMMTDLIGGNGDKRNGNKNNQVNAVESVIQEAVVVTSDKNPENDRSNDDDEIIELIPLDSDEDIEKES